MEDCELGREEARSLGKGLQLENFCASSMVVEGGDLVKEVRVSSEQSWLDPWVATSRI